MLKYLGIKCYVCNLFSNVSEKYGEEMNDMEKNESEGHTGISYTVFKMFFVRMKSFQNKVLEKDTTFHQPDEQKFFKDD